MTAGPTHPPAGAESTGDAMGGAKLDTAQWDEALEEMVGRADDITPVGDQIHTEILRQSRGKKRFKDVTGRLWDSIVNPRSPDHIYKKAPKRVTVASRDPASVFNPSYVPVIDAAPLVSLIADHVIEDDDGTS